MAIGQPGSQDIYTYERKEIRAVNKEYVLLGITVAPTDIAIPIGTVLGMATDSQLFKPYVNTATDGSEVARCILAEPIEPSTGSQSTHAFVRGYFYKDRLVGLDDDAMKDLNAREVVPNILSVS